MKQRYLLDIPLEGFDPSQTNNEKKFSHDETKMEIEYVEKNDSDNEDEGKKTTEKPIP